MRSTTVQIVVLAVTAVTPAFAAPLLKSEPLEARANGKWSKIISNVNEGMNAAAGAAQLGATVYGMAKNHKREELDFEAREYDDLEARANDKWSKIISNVNEGMSAAAGAAQLGATVYGMAKNGKRNDFDLEAREYDELEARANGKWSKIISNVNEGMNAAAGAAQLGATVYGMAKNHKREAISLDGLL